MGGRRNNEDMKISDVSDNLVVWIQSIWSPNSICEVFDKKSKRWIECRISKIFTRQNIEWMEVKWRDIDNIDVIRTKMVRRDDDKSVRPLSREEAMKIYKWAHKVITSYVYI